MLASRNDSQPINVISTDPDKLIANLRIFIKRNQSLPAFFAEIDANLLKHQAKLDTLKAVIENADMTHVIFSDRDCMPYLLYLIERKQIPFWSGLTMYHTLIAWSQFSEQQHLKSPKAGEIKRAHSIKNIRRTAMISLVNTNQNKLSSAGTNYLSHVIFHFKILGIIIDISDIEKYLLTLPCIEQHVLEVTYYSANSGKYDVDTFLGAIRDNVPFFRSLKRNIFYLPSCSLISFFLSKMSNVPMQMMPEFGFVSNETLHQLHTENYHPVQLYSLLVKNTLTEVHGYHCGPFPVLVHDIGHCFWASLIAPEERNIINSLLIPYFLAQKKTDQSFTVNQAFDNFCMHLTDYDLTPYINYSQAESRFFKYVCHAVMVTMQPLSVNSLDDESAASLIKALRELSIMNITKDTKHNFWMKLCEHLDSKYKHLRRPAVMTDANLADDELAPTSRNSFFSSSDGERDANDSKQQKRPKLNTGWP